MGTLLTVALLSFRSTVIVLCGTSVIYLIIATDGDDFTPFKFLGLALCCQLTWSVTRLVYDARVTLFNAPLPGLHTSVAIVIGELALSCLTYAAGSVSVGTWVYLAKDTHLCAFMEARACSRYKVSSFLALSASIFTSAIAVLLLRVLASRLG